MGKAKYIVTPTAKSDIRDIINYIRRDNPNAAKAVRLRLYADIRRLGDFPHIGRSRPDVPPADAKVWTCYPYLIIYLAEPSPVEILRVLHGARDLPTVLNQ